MAIFRGCLSFVFSVFLLISSSSALCQWVSANLPYQGSVRCFAVKGTNIYAGTEGGVFRSTDDGVSWIAANTGIPNAAIYSLDVTGANILAGTGWFGMFRSFDDGASWSNVPTFPSTDVYTIANKGTNLFAGTYVQGILCSTDGGSSWNSVDTGLPYHPSVHFLAVWGTNLVALIDDMKGPERLFRSTDNGSSWAADNSGLPRTWTLSSAIIGGSLFVATDSVDFFSTDNGNNWIEASNDLSKGANVSALTVSGTNLIAGTYDHGVFLSIDTGASWVNISLGLTTNVVYALAIRGSYLFAGSNSGVWCRPLSELIGTSAVAEQPMAVASAVRVYPNPFSEKTTIRFTSAERGPVQVSIVNLLGVEVARLFDGELDAGEHSFGWDANGVAAGTYFNIIRSTDGVERATLLVAH